MSRTREIYAAWAAELSITAEQLADVLVAGRLACDRDGNLSVIV